MFIFLVLLMNGQPAPALRLRPKQAPAPID
jgi:hypothetical protein